MLYTEKSMQAGIKIGLRDYQTRIPETKAKICEVYFRIDQKELYKPLFKLLHNHGIASGLHFWGFLKNNYMYNLAFPEAKIQEESVSLIKETIEIAAFYKQRYVNIHPGYFDLMKINLDNYVFEKAEKSASYQEGQAVLLENLKTLHDFSEKHGVLLLTETMTCRENLTWYSEKDRLNPTNFHAVPVALITALAQKGFYITNDFGHTLCDEISNDRDFLFDKLYQKTKKLSKQTFLIHTNTSKPPFTGVDTHNGVTESDFNQDVLPNKKQLIKLLRIFKNRNDLWLIPEPLKNHEENFQNLVKILQEM